MSEPTNYPLSWPVGWPRVLGYSRKGGPFRVSLSGALDRLEAELRRLGASHLVISTNLRPRLDGRPYADQALRVTDPGVAIYFRLKEQPRVLACDRYLKIEQNIAAIAAHVEALRGIERWGVGSLEQAFAGYAALPAPGADWRTVFGYEHDHFPALASVKARYRERAREIHPDRGGDHDQLVRLNQAMEAAERELDGERTHH